MKDPIYSYDLAQLVSYEAAGALLFIALLVPAVLRYIRVLQQRNTLPPGPFPWPLVGNTLSLPPNKPWVYFEKLSKYYDNPAITVWLGSKPTVWLNDAWSADELLNKRAGIYSSRPELIVFRDLGTGPSNIISMPYDSRWRDMRKVTHHGVGMQQTRSYRLIQDLESKQIAYDLCRDPKNYVAHLERYATSVVSIIGFGRRLASTQDPIIQQVLHVMALAGELNVPGKSMPMLMETFPSLAKAPNWVPWKAKPRNRRKGVSFFYNLAKEAAEENPNENTCKNLFNSHIENFKMSKREAANIAGNLFGAGAETSSNTLITFILACVAFPEVLPRAWEELDRVVGHERSPQFDDQEHLPYINAFVTEVFRWRSTAIMSGQPHANIQADVWNGYVFPKNTWIQANLWAIHRHPREFPEPDRFNPERHLDPNRPAYPSQDGYSTFGFGRRICAGKALAEQGIFITCARMLWAFNITKDLDPAGNPIPVDIFAYSNGLNMRPEEFPARFLPRSDTIKATIDREAKEALHELERFNVPTKYRLFDFGTKHKIEPDLD